MEEYTIEGLLPVYRLSMDNETLIKIGKCFTFNAKYFVALRLLMDKKHQKISLNLSLSTGQIITIHEFTDMKAATMQMVKIEDKLRNILVV